MTHAAPAPGWFPVSPCGAPCVPAEPTGPHARLPWRIARLLVVLGAVTVTAPLLPLLPHRWRRSWLRVSARGVLAAAGVRVEVVGPRRFAAGGVLVVANHVSWIEVLALSAVQPLRMVAKSEIRAWPLFGPVAAALGAVFVDRGRLRSLPDSVAGIRRALTAGDPVGAFPEGTTWCGTAGGPFRRAVFQAAIEARTPVQPVAVTLRTRDGRRTPAAVFVGDQTLLASLSRVMRLPHVVCELTVLPTISPHGSRAVLATRAAAAISGVTGVPHPTRTLQAPPGRPRVGGRPSPQSR